MDKQRKFSGDIETSFGVVSVSWLEGAHEEHARVPFVHTPRCTEKPGEYARCYCPEATAGYGDCVVGGKKLDKWKWVSQTVVSAHTAEVIAGKQHLKMYDMDGVHIAECGTDRWLKIDLEDGSYGSPEYKIVNIKECKCDKE